MKRSLKYTDVWGAGQAEWAMPGRDDLDALVVGDLIRFEGRVWTIVYLSVARNLITLED